MTRSEPRHRSLELDVLGSTVQLTFPDNESDDTFQRLATAWSGAQSTSTVPDAVLTVSCVAENAGSVDVFARSYEQLAAAVSTKVTLRGIERARGRSLMLHAAGLALPDGRVIAFVAPSGGGKTTLAAALGTKYGYVSDETVLIERDLTVVPYRKPLSVIEDPSRKHRKVQISPRQLGLRDLPESPLTLAAIVMFYRDDEYSDIELETTGLAEGISDLVGQVSYFGELPDSVAMLADVLERTGGLRTLRYRDCADVAEKIDDILALHHNDLEWADASSCVPSSEISGYVRAPDVTAVETNGVVVSIKSNTVRVLSGLAPVIWRAAESGATVEDIEKQLIDEFGAPPSAANSREATQLAIDELVGEGVLCEFGSA